MRPAVFLIDLILPPVLVLLVPLALACDGGDDDDDTGTTAATESIATTTSPTTTQATGADSPTGMACPLLGLYVECGDDGRTYCDAIAGALQYGPCLTELACDITEPEDCFSRCELVDGVPTKIPQDICSTSGI